MNDESPTTPSDHSEASFDIVPDDANSDSPVHVPSPSSEDRVVNKLLDVLRGTTEVLAQNQVVLSNLGQTMEAVFKDARQDSVRFKVENAGNGKVALRSCGRYLSVAEDGRRVMCDSRTLDAWSKFEWIDHESGEVSLRGPNGNYLSSAYGRSFLTCNRDEVGPQERFTVA